MKTLFKIDVGGDMKMMLTEEQLRDIVARACDVYQHEVIMDYTGVVDARTPAEFAKDFVACVSAMIAPENVVECPIILVNCYSCSHRRDIPTCLTNGVSTCACSLGKISDEDTNWSLRKKWCDGYRPSSRAGVNALVDYNRKNEKKGGGK